MIRSWKYLTPKHEYKLLIYYGIHSNNSSNNYKLNQ